MIPDVFLKLNVTDTCSIWHLIGANTLFAASRLAGLAFVVTQAVEYECFVKPQQLRTTDTRDMLQKLLSKCLDQGQVQRVSPSLEDLQDTIELARRRGIEKRIGLGELSCAALARTLNTSAVLTDNWRDVPQIEPLVEGRLQTTARLLGWLLIEGHLSDSDVVRVIDEHKTSEGTMANIYERAYQEACEKRLMLQSQ